MEIDQFENEELQTEEPGVVDAGTEEFIPDEDPDQEDQLEDVESGEETDSVPEESGKEPEYDAAEDELEESGELISEIISGNDVVTISGNAVIFPEDFDFSMFQVSPDGESENLVVDALETQTNLIFGVSAVVIFLLGVIAGILIVHGFRLRRV